MSPADPDLPTPVSPPAPASARAIPEQQQAEALLKQPPPTLPATAAQPPATPAQPAPTSEQQFGAQAPAWRDMTPLQRAEVHTATMAGPDPAARDYPLRFNPHGPLAQVPQPIINDNNKPPIPTPAPPEGNATQPGPRVGKVAPYIGQEAGTVTGSFGPQPVQPDITPVRAYNMASPQPFGEAFTNSMVQGFGPLGQAVEAADLFAEASKFAPDPNYHWNFDPQVVSRPNMWSWVKGSRSARETRYILGYLDHAAYSNRQLAQNGFVASAGYFTGMMLDPANYVGVKELEIPGVLNEAGQMVKPSITTRAITGARQTARVYALAELPEQGLASGLNPSRPNGSFINGMIAAIGTGAFLGIPRGLLATSDLTANLAKDWDAVEPLDGDTHAPGNPPGPEGSTRGVGTGTSADGAPPPQGGFNAHTEPPEGGTGGGAAPPPPGTSTGQATIFPVKDRERLRQALIQQESGGDPNIHDSSAGAAGLMQVMPDTARALAKYFGDDGLMKGWNDEQIQAWLKEERQGEPEQVRISGMSGFHDAEVIHDPDRQAQNLPSYAIRDRQSGALMQAEDKSGNGWYDTTDDAIDRARRWDHRAVVTRRGTTNSEVYGTKLYNDLVDKYGDQNLALLAYNAGETIVDDLRFGTNNSKRNTFGPNGHPLRLGDPLAGEVSSKDFAAKFPYAQSRDYVEKINGREAPGEAAAYTTADAVKDGAGSTSTLHAGEPHGPTQEILPADRAILYDAKGNPVTDHNQATFVRINQAQYPIEKVSILNDKGEWLGGAPAAEGTPSVMSRDAIFLGPGGMQKEMAGATHVIDHSTGASGPYSQFKWYGPAGEELRDGVGATHFRMMDEEEAPAIPRDSQGRPVPGFLHYMWKHKGRIMKETAEWAVELAGQNQARPQPPRDMGADARFNMGQSVGAAQAPGRTSVSQAQSLWGNTMKNALGLEKLPVNAQVRLANSPSAVARSGGERITEHSWTLAKNTSGMGTIRSSWAKMKRYMGQFNQALFETQQDYWDYVHRVTNDRMKNNPFARIATQIKGTSGVMSYQQFLDEVGLAKRYLGTPDVRGLLPEAINAAVNFDQRVFKPMAEAADDSGAFLKPLEDQYNKLSRIQAAYFRGGQLKKAHAMFSQLDDLAKGIRKQQTKEAAGGTYRMAYLPRVPNQKALAADPAGFTRILRNYGVGAQEADQVLAQWRQTQPFTAFGPDSLGRASSLHHRSLDFIPDKALEKYLVHDISVTGQSYVRQMGYDIGTAENFGGDDLSLTKHLGDIMNDYSHNLIPAAKTAEERENLTKLLARDLKDTRDLHGMGRGTFGLPSNPQAWTSRTIRIAKQFNAMTQLTGFISALPDLARIPMVHGLNATIGGVLSMFGDGMKTLNLAKRDMRLAGESADLMLALRSGLGAHVSDSFANSTAVERIIQHAASIQPAFDGMAWYQDTLKGLAGAIGGTRMIEAMQRVVKNEASVKDVEMLARNHLGIVDEHGVVDDALIRRILDQYNQHGHNTGSLKIANTDLWHDDPHAAEMFQAALGKDVRGTIAGGATPGETPTWMNTQLGSLLGQYRGYGFTAMNRILIPGLQERDRQFLFGAAAMVGLGYIVARAQATARGEDFDNKPWRARLIEAVDRSGILAWTMDVNNAMEGLTHGQIGIRPMLGVGGYGDLSHQVGSIAGPTGSTAFNVFNSVFGNQSDPRTIQAQHRLIPFHNIWQTKALMDYVAKQNGHSGQGPAFDR